MAKLIREYISYDDLEYITEAKENKKIWKIRGPYLQSEVKNHNKRRYSKVIIEREVGRLNKEEIEKKGGIPGHLDHPDTPEVKWQDACHIIKELRMEGNDAFGCSELLEDTVHGRTVICALEHGVKPMISSRGIGSVKPNGDVDDSYKLITADVVVAGSAPDSYLEGILESKEFIIGNDGEIVEMAVNKLQHQVDKKYNSTVTLGYLLEFIHNIRKNK